LTSDFEVTLSRTGEYLLVLFGGSPTPVPYSFRIVSVETTARDLTLGATISGSLADPGDQHTYTFRGAPGQRLYYDAMDGDFDPIFATLLNPRGVGIFVTGNADGDSGPFTLNEEGIYTLVIDGSVAAIGDYRFRLLDISRQPILPLDSPQSLTLDPGYSAQLYQYAGPAGQRLYFRNLGSTGSGAWYFFGPGNESLDSRGITGDLEVTLGREGLQVLVISGTSANPLPISFEALTPNDNNAPPTVSSIPDQNTLSGVPIEGIPFAVGDAETPAANLTVTASSANPVVIPNTGLVLGGSGASRNIAITPATGQFGSVLITVRVNDASGARATSTFVVNVAPTPPLIVQQPQSATVPLGGNVTFTVVAEGIGPITYQWRKNGINLPGATGTSLTRNGVQLGDAGNYSVAVANPFGAVSSAIAALVIPIDPLALTNGFGQRAGFSDPSRIGRSSNAGADREPGEPNHAGKTGGKSMWMTWNPTAGGIATFSTRGSTFDTLLAIYTGTQLGSLTPIASDDDDGGFFTSEVTFNAVAGTPYQIAVDGLAGADGDIILSWNLEVTPDVLPEIVTQPVDQTVGLGGTAVFGVTAPGPNLRYQWFYNGATIVGANTNLLVINNAQVSSVGNYFVVISRGNRSVQSRTVSLQINAPEEGPAENASSDDKFADLATSGGGGGVAVQSVPPSNALRKASASVARGFTGTQIFSTVGSSKEQGEPNHCGIIGGASQWFAYESPVNGTLTISTDGSDFDTVLAVYTGTGVNFASLQPGPCDNDSGLDGKTSRVSFSAEAGTMYYIAVDGVNGASGNVRLNYRLELAQTPLQLDSVSVQGAAFRFRLSGLPGRTYTIQGTTNLVSWIPLITTNSASGIIDFLDPASPSLSQRCYRAVMEQ
jgi:hypothetical protein